MLNSPLDELIDQLGGPDCVAEMTGRKGRVVREGGKGDRVHYELRDSGYSTLESLNNREVTQMFLYTKCGMSVQPITSWSSQFTTYRISRINAALQ